MTKTIFTLKKSCRLSRFRDCHVPLLLKFGIVIFSVGLAYYSIAMGMFTNDYLWIIKSTLSNILPESIHNKLYHYLQVELPNPGESYIMPVVAPIAGLMLTYSSNIIFQFLNEQQDKKFLRETFGTYISPDVL